VIKAQPTFISEDPSVLGNLEQFDEGFGLAGCMCRTSNPMFHASYVRHANVNLN